jgi:hypothetical protein
VEIPFYFMDTTYHIGETAVQELFGEKALAERNGKVITAKVVPGAINFIERQHFFLASSRNLAGGTWVSALAGANGFIKVKSENTLEINTDLLYSNPYDVFWTNIEEVQKIGLLFIELSSRRRFRINGSLRTDGKKLEIIVSQAYPNCPQYIQQRHVQPAEKPDYSGEVSSGETLIEPFVELIKMADTFFVGSSSPAADMDASHRGGLPGFVLVKDNSTLVIPDYPGNSMFNTFGNFYVNPAAGITFIDFQSNTNLQLSGSAQVFMTNDEPLPGQTNRYWVFKIAKWVQSENLKGFEWNFVGYSPFNPK